MPYYEMRGSNTMRVIGPMRGDKLSVSDGWVSSMPVVATLDPQGRFFVLTMQAYKQGANLLYNHQESVPFDSPGWFTPPYSGLDHYSPWANICVQIDPSDMQVKIYSGSWSGDGHDVHSLCVFRSGVYYQP